MNKEIVENRGFHVEVVQARARGASIFFIYGPCDTVVDATSNSLRARAEVMKQRQWTLYHIKEQRPSGVMYAIRFGTPKTGFIMADLIGRVIK